MKLLLFTTSIFVFGCSTTVLSSVELQLQQLQQEVEQLKRSNDDKNEKIRTQDEKIARLEQEFRSGRTLVLQSVEVPVVFSTTLQADTSTNDSPVVFENVNLNIGDGYDEFTSVFQPPFDGVYLLTFYGSAVDTDGGFIFIKRDDDRLCQAYFSNDLPGNTATCTTIAELTVGDSVRVTGDSSEPTNLRGGSWSGFTGVLIYDS